MLPQGERLEPAELVPFIEPRDLSPGDEDPLVAVLDHDERQAERFALALVDAVERQGLKPFELAADDQAVLEGHFAGRGGPPAHGSADRHAEKADDRAGSPDVPHIRVRSGPTAVNDDSSMIRHRSAGGT